METNESRTLAFALASRWSIARKPSVVGASSETKKVPPHAVQAGLGSSDVAAVEASNGDAASEVDERAPEWDRGLLLSLRRGDSGNCSFDLDAEEPEPSA